MSWSAPLLFSCQMHPPSPPRHSSNLNITHYDAHLPQNIPFFPSSYRPAFTIEGKSLAIPEEFNFDVASWKVGEFVDCTALSEMMQSFGGFPSSLLVREEMKVVWSILVDGIAKQKTRWVMFGSPGVGKSILTVLLCFHLAQAHGKPMFLVRRLYGENDGPQSGVVAICIHPGGRAVGYPKEDDDDVDLKAIRAAFGTSYKRPTRMTTVLDGWSQSELARSTVGELFGNFNLLITFEQYKQDYEDFRHLVILPSWKDESFQSLWNHLGWEPSTFHEHRYYSSGSVRDFFRPIIEIQSRTHRVTAGLPEKMCMGLMARYGHSSGEYIDYLRHCYLDNNNSESYIDPSCWKNMVVSAYALKLLSVNAPLDVYERSVEVAESCGPIHYGWVFKALVHQLFRIPNMVVTFHVRRDHQVGAPEDEYESISLGKKVSIECHGKNYSEATLSLSNRFVDMTRNTYWHPNYPMFPVIDAIVCLPDKKTILYVHLTVGTEHDVDFEQLTEIHDTVKQSLQVTDSEGWTFKYVAIGPRELNVNRITLNLKTNKNKSTARTVDEVTIWKGYVTYSIE